ncbi:MAG: hypothetical protein E7574_05360 [Ruminococcaceae bacterium]|nr:hypothetical protein [Oscillospiraceae bacterium]
MSNKNMKIASGVIAGTMAVTVLGITMKSMRKPKSKLQKSTARTLNTISSVTQSLADMLD